ncbi:MAG: hypothetical protein JNK02_12180 [Planctomycetes bacterium]|nr:hypothetical protein [Planctomycetota bacterium]
MNRLATLLPAVLCLAYGVWLAATVPASPALGWDESMHALLPAARVVEALRAGQPGVALEALLGCAQYPPAWPAVLALAQLPGGVSEALARAVTSLAWGAALVCVVLLARRAAVGDARADPRVAGWTALAFGALSPLAASYAGTLFLEVPSALAVGLALWAWLWRADAPSRAREVVAGLAIVLALFTKWNYGLLVALALAADLAFEILLAARAGRARELLVRSAWLAAPIALALAWWFVLPLPGGLDRAAEHRAAFAGFLGGNLGAAPASAAERVLYAATGIGASVRASLVVALFALVALVALGGARRPAVRVLALCAAALLAAPLVHPFFLDRFLVPGLVPLFALVGLGCARALPRTRFARATAVAVLALTLSVAPGVDGAWLADRLGRLPEAEPARTYVREVLAERVRLGPRRRLPTAGLARAEHDALLDLAAAEVRAGERVGWIGMSSEISPAVLHLGLCARGGDGGWFLERDPPALDLTYFGTDPGCSDAEILAYAARFDVLLWTDPSDLRERRERAFAGALRDRLVALRPSEVRELGRVAIARPLRPPLEARLFACRPRP